MKIFVVEDDLWYGELISYHLGLNPDFEIRRFENGKECLNHIQEKPDIITLDYSLPDTTGSALLRKLKEFLPETPVIILSGQHDVNTAIGLLKEGAYDYIVKDDDARERLWNTILKIQENHSLKKEINSLKDELNSRYAVSKAIIGNSASIKKIFTEINSASRTKINVMIKGESGTGKELVAKAIHYNSEQAKKPFVAVNVAAIPNDLIESELFGYEKGAFTGANIRKKGKLEEAADGTLFLDEIAEMDLNMQVKLLRVLQERELSRLGGNEIIPLKFRLIVASHKDLESEINNGSFRQDLFYRLLGLSVEIPPLRERGDDILLLSKFFADGFCKENKLNKVLMPQETTDKLLSYTYPGNVRELKSIIELGVVLSENGTIKPDDIRFSNHRLPKTELLTGKDKTLKEYTFEIIKSYLNKYDQNVVLVAEKLGIGKSTIYQMLKKEME